MPTIDAIVKRLLPQGSRPQDVDNWGNCPEWPPDAFAVMAKLVDLSGIYCSERYTTPGIGYTFDLKKIKFVAESWGGFDGRPFSRRTQQHIQRLWQTVLSCGGASLVPTRTLPPWADAAFELLAIADAACEGVGFVADEVGARPLADFLADDFYRLLIGVKHTLPSLPHSIGLMVPAQEACIQPKSRTPQVGCTLRSLSHHLALLPAITEVKTSWRFALDPSDLLSPKSSLNILVVPFPYLVTGACFKPGQVAGTPPLDGTPAHYFAVEQRWLYRGQKRISAEEFTGFVLQLIEKAGREVDKVDGVVLPELALDEGLADKVSRALAKSGIEFFVSGISVRSKKTGQMTRNVAFSRVYSNRATAASWQQNKHHRWRLDGGQICRYQLGDRLNPTGIWWEEIGVAERHCWFYVFRRGVSMATLICEDLARIDPVQTVIRSVGPNLVIALLMDGPQLRERWSGRYATVLAEDPGSAVLSVTSLGMVNRSRAPGAPDNRVIALWKGSDGVATELQIERGHQALLLTLSVKNETNYTLDGRSDGGFTLGLSVSGTHSLGLEKIPKWLL